MDSPPPISPSSPLKKERLCPYKNVASIESLLLAFVLFFSISANAQTLSGSFSSVTDVIATGNGFTAAGSTLSLTLNFAPPIGSELTVVNNTSLSFISGTFSNLVQGQVVNLTYNSITYTFVADYYGGTGNDLVLVWKNNRLMGWGNNQYGSLGDNTTTQRLLPTPVLNTGVLAGKTILKVSTGATQTLALCSDGTLAAWGSNYYGEVGDNSTIQRNAPVLVNTDSGVSALFGKTVVAVSANEGHCLALCSDGTVVAWGRNDSGQLGDGSQTQRNAPMAVDITSSNSALKGKTVVSISAGERFSLALCSDGTVAAWGINDSGQLGDNSSTARLLPVTVNTSSGLSSLFGKTVTAIAAGGSHSMALCSDGTVVTWGVDDKGQLGDNITHANSLVPTVVNTSIGLSALYGKIVTSIAAGTNHCVAQCSDRTLVAWGYNNGALGNNGTSDSKVPVAVNVTNGVSALYGRTVLSVSAGTSYSTALCTDGTLASWGVNFNGDLGDNSVTDRIAPTSVNTTQLNFGEVFSKVSRGGSNHYTSIAIVSTPAPEIMVTDPDGISLVDGISTFDMGTSLLSSTGVSKTITIQNNGTANLTGLSISKSGSNANDFVVSSIGTGTLPPGGSTTFTIRLAGGTSGSKTAALQIASNDADENPFDILLIGNVSTTLAVSYASTSQTPLTSNDGVIPSGSIVNLALNFAPPTGTNLTVVNNTNLNFISGTFSNLVQGQVVNLSYGGVVYQFVANYYGGTGNDLVLVWKNNRAYAWGGNNNKKLGTTTAALNYSTQPVPVDAGILDGKTLLALSSGGGHSLALCSDGTIAAWGEGDYGQLGNNGGDPSQIPIQVNTTSGTSALYGKNVIGIAAGYFFSVALCSDGTVVSWGDGSQGQNGNGSLAGSNTPVFVSTGTALAGKTVVAIAAGYNHCLALCSDGTIVSWGNNSSGQLGDNSTTRRVTPVAVNTTNGVSALYGKTVTAIAAGYFFSLALCSDGTVCTWGTYANGVLGDGSGTDHYAPVAVSTTSGTSALFGKTVTSISAGAYHSRALCSDGTLVAWGSNANGQLGDNTTSDRIRPVAVNVSLGISALNGKTVTSMASGSSHSIAICTDETKSTWGGNNLGELADNSTTQRNAPVLVDQSTLAFGEHMTAVFSGSSATHNLAVVAAPPAPIATTLAASTSAVGGAILNGTVNANGNSVAVSFDYGPTTAYGTNVAATPATLNGTTATAVSATISGLTPGATYHCRVNAGGVSGNDMTFTATPNNNANLSNLILSTSTLSPSFTSGTTNYTASVATGTNTLTVTPTTADSTATVAVNGTSVTSGTASGAISLVYGSNMISTVVTAQDGSKKTYTVTVTRPVPTTLAATFNAASDVPITGSVMTVTGSTVNFTLNYAPTVGTNLTVVNNTGLGFINGTFSNLAQGQLVPLSYNGVTYNFVANYYSGTGNDLVLQWASNRLVAWGLNANGQLGNGTTTNSSAIIPVNQNGVLASKTVTAIAEGWKHTLALCSDGTLAAWGSNSNGQLGNNSTTDSNVPIQVYQGGVLAGKTVVSIAAGQANNLVLCSDGTLASWGYNADGELGNNSTVESHVPVLVDMAGILYGKSVVAIAAGFDHNLALCSDGTLVAWGYNAWGQLGNNTSSLGPTSTPVAIDISATDGSALAGKTVVAMTAGTNHSVALCADGTLAAWGLYTNGELGNGNSAGTNAGNSIPMAVTLSGVLSGKFVTSAVTGDAHTVVLGSDGTLASWGPNNHGQLGNGSTTSGLVPVLVNAAGVLSGKTVARLAAGLEHSFALCSDGTLAAWGDNSYGQLGNGSTTGSTVPIAANLSALASGERIVTLVSGSLANHNLALVAVPHPQIVVQQPVGTNLASGSSSVNYALRSISQTFTILNSGSNTLSGIGVTITGTNASDFSVSAAPATTVAPGASTTLTVAFAPGGTGSRSATLQIASNDYITSTFSIALTGNGNPTLAASYSGGSDVPVTTNGFTATGNAVNLMLNFAPTAGVDLMLVNNTSATPISGTFSNLPQGQAVALSFGGSTYNFVADYLGGTGNDLVLLQQGPGALDFSFGTRGRVVTSVSSGNDYGSATAMQSDGKIIVGGWATNGSNDDFAVLRYNANGTLDTSFGGTGKVLTPIGTGDDECNSIAVQSDGKILAGGVATTGGVHSFALVRYNASGSLDTNFGNGGIVTTAVSADSIGSSLAIQSDGKIILAGSAGNGGSNFALVRYNTNGTLDTSFNSTGKVSSVIGNTNDRALSVVVQGDGKIVAAGISGISSNYYFAVARYNANGTLDTSLGGTGSLLMGLGTGNDAGFSAAVQQDGKILVAGYASNGPTNHQYALMRLNTNGSFDTSFNGTGKVSTVIGSDDVGRGIALQSDGKIIVAGEAYMGSATNRDFALARYNTDGSLDNSFNGSGKVKTTISTGDDFVAGVAVQSDGKIVVVGNSNNGSIDFALVRYLGDTVHNATFTTLTDVPLTSNGFTATGQSITFTLNYAPTVGTNLTVVNNTGLGFINGTFSNLAQGQAVSLTYNGTTYPFVANYYGGTGNDLVLQWAYNRLVAWGANSNGQLGNNSTTNSSVPIAVNESGVLAGKTVISTAVGGLHSLALCSDGTLAAWGCNAKGQLGNGNTTDSNVSVLVNQSGVLAGKTVVAVAAGYQHSLALCSDGTMAAWGWNSYGYSGASGDLGSLGNGSTNESSVPMAVDTSGVLNGKTVVSIAAGYAHNLALCSDGTLVSWGNNADGELGNNSSTNSTVPVLVDQTPANSSFLYGKTVVAVGAGIDHSMAVCSDGTLAGWGYNGFGQLGNNSNVSRSVPIAVYMSGVLSGKSVTSVVGGADHMLALCADGTLSAWGLNSSGQLGNNSTTNWGYPLLVSTSGVLASRTVVAISGGGLHNLALCSDGKLVAWGDNSNGQLGNGNTTNSTVPVLVTTSGLSTGERIVAASCECSANHNLALVATPAHPQIVVQQAGATLTSGSAAASYAFSGTTQSFTILNDGAATLSGIGASFSGSNAADFTLTSAPATTLAPGASTTFSVMFASSGSGTRSATMQIASNDPTDNPFTASLSGAGSRALAATYTTGNEVPLSSNGFTATGSTVNFGLNYAPAVGMNLTVVNNTGLSFINGTFSNLAQGHLVPITYNGVTYNFVANYYGGTGNDLVLQWAYNRVAAWGFNSNAQLGNGTTSNSTVPSAVINTGVLAGKTVVSVSTAASMSVALCSDGTLISWGGGLNSGLLGNGSTSTNSVPVLVTQAGVLSGKTLVEVTSGGYHNLVLFSDGTVASWGINSYGQLGNGTNDNATVPVLVNPNGVLAGKTVVAIAAGVYHSLALCSDGTLVSWGANSNGQLGSGNNDQSNVPVLVSQSGALAGKTVMIIISGGNFSLALCSDGTLAGWGQNLNGQLGNGTNADSNVPVLVNQTGLLAGKIITGVSAGASFTAALCADGTLASWGQNNHGQLGIGSTTDSTQPMRVSQTGVLNGKRVTSVACGTGHCLALCADGTLAAWGEGDNSELGNGSTSDVSVPVLVNNSSLTLGERWFGALSGSSAHHNLALVAVPHPQIVVQQPAGTNLTSGSSTVNYAFRGTSQTFTIQNSGSNALTGIGITIAGTNAGDFSMGAAPATTLAPGASTTFTLSFAPTGTGSRSATLQIASNDYTTSLFSIALTGNGNTALTANYSSGSTVPITSNGFTATSSNLNLTLGYAPTPFSTLTVVNNTSANPITGTFGNLAQGQTLTLSYGGSTYNFFADYFGGDGNDLVLVMQGPGVLDYSFGTRGRVTTAVGSGVDLAYSVAVQSDGKIVVAGYSSNGNNLDFAILRYNANDALDISFNSTGKVTTDFGSDDYGYCIAVQSDGKIVVGGATGPNNSQSFALARYNPNGTLDTSFNGVGKVITGIGANAVINSLVVQSDGKIIVAGYNGSGTQGTNHDFALARYNANGTQDTTFNGTGNVTTDFGGDDRGQSMALQSDGKIVVVGYTYTSILRFAVARYNSDGSLDRSFSGTGKLATVIGSDNDNALGVAVQSDGKIVVAGSSSNLSNNRSRNALVRYNTDGSLDTSFNGTGIVITTVGNNNIDVGMSLAVQSDGRILVAGDSFNGSAFDFSLVRYNANGSLDNDFCGTGKLTTAIANGDADGNLVSMVLQADGKIIVAGSASNGANSDFAIARYLVETAHDVSFASAFYVPLTSNGFTATGQTLNLTLNYAPTVGTNLTVINNTGLKPIGGVFTNLSQGQAVAMTYNGTTYNFVANYFGGTGNDLVLQWAYNRLLAWGDNSAVELGINNTTTQMNLPTAVVAAAPLYGKTITSVSAGNNFSLAVCADGTVAAWGTNAYGQLGNGSTSSAQVAAAVTQSGVLVGKTVVAVAAGGQHSLALCSDGTLAAWGSGGYGQLGNNSTLNSAVPVLVDTTGALFGKRVVAIGAGFTHSVALCSDGTVVCWGDNSLGQLGNNSTTRSYVPAAVSTAGILSGKTVMAVAVGYSHTLALCTDGSVTAWGLNTSGQLGNNSSVNSSIPVAVATSGLLSGRKGAAIAAGGNQSLVLCSDGTLAAWGTNDHGQLGNNSATTSFATPQAVDLTGVLAGKTVTSIGMGYRNGWALCSDGSMAAWGWNANGQLGNNSTTDSLGPVAVNNTMLAAAESFVAVASGSDANHVLGIAATTAPAPSISLEQPVGTPLVSNSGTQSYGSTVVSGTKSKTFLIRNNGTATLSGISLSLSGTGAAQYAVTANPAATLAPGDSTTFTLAFTPTSAGVKPATLNIASNVSGALNPFFVKLTGTGSNSLNATYVTGTEQPASASNFTASGKTISFTLNYVPLTGTSLMVVNNTGPAFINGVFSNLAQGQTVALSYNGVTYNFIANYYGGTGNDLVLQWAEIRLLAWGKNVSGTLGNNSTTQSNAPVAVNMSGVLSGKTVMALACADRHTLALCTDGTLAAWGANSSGQIGDGTTINRLLPVLVNTIGVLAGKTVVSIAAGYDFSVAVCSDGSVATWGMNSNGQLGEGTTTNHSSPVLVNTAGALAGKLVTALAAGADYCVAQCSDGSVAAWGDNSSGQLGNNSSIDSHVPVAVDTLVADGSALAGRTVVAVAAGQYHSLALCSDGTLVGWGDGSFGELGNNSTNSSLVPVTVDISQADGSALAGRNIVSIGAGQFHSMALCSDGTLATWGDNSSGPGQLGVSGIDFSIVPLSINGTAALTGKTVSGIAAGQTHNVALMTDGTLAAWADNSLGQLGVGTTVSSSLVPVAVSTAALAAGESVLKVVTGSTASHSISVVAIPLSTATGPAVTTNAATNVGKTSVTFNGLTNPNGLATTVYFEYGLTTSYGSQTATQSLGNGTTSQTVVDTSSTLQPNTTYHYRINATNSVGNVVGSDVVFTTLADPPAAVSAATTAITNSTATLSGAVNPNGRATNVYFEFGPTILYGNTTPVQPLGVGTSAVNITAAITGLSPNTTYHCHIVASNAGGTASGSDITFTTTNAGIPTAVPSVTTGSVANVTTTTATLQGQVNPNGGITNAYFEYGTTTSYGGTSANLGAGSGTAPGSLSADISALQPGTLYHYHLVAQNSLGTTLGSDATFTTLYLPPTVTTGSSSVASTTSVNVNGTVNANNASAQVFFDYGTDGVTFPSSVGATPATVTGSSSTTVSAVLPNLLQGTTYYYRVRATSAGGTSTGSVASFQVAILSGLLQVFPAAPPSATGSVTMTLNPSGINSGWRIVGELQWRSSGSTATGLITSDLNIEYRPVPGYIEPPQETVSVVSGQAAVQVSRDYYVAASSGSGGISVTLKPDSIAASTVTATSRAQWRFLGEDNTEWRDSGTTVSSLTPGSYSVECKPVSGRATPSLATVIVSNGQTSAPTITYFLSDTPSGVSPSVLAFSTVSTDQTKPYAHVGQIRSSVGVSSGFVVMPRVVATAGHVVFDDGTLSTAQGLQWLFERDAGNYEPVPQTPRGYYIFDGYTAQRAAENTPGTSSPQSQTLDVAAMYFLADAGRGGGYGGFLASDLAANEFLISSANKILVGYPVDGITSSNQGRMFATPPANVTFTAAYGRTFTTADISSVGGNSGGPLCVQYQSGAYYPAAVYLGGTGQTVVRAIDSGVIDLFNRAQVSGNGGANNTGGGITQTSVTVFGSASNPGAIAVTIAPAAAVSAGGGWRLSPETSYRQSGAQKSGLSAGSYVLQLTTVAGYQAPTSQTVTVAGGQVTSITFTYAAALTAQQTWRQTFFGVSTNTGNAADTANPAGDGISNLLKYALNLDPTKSSKLPTNANLNGSNLEYNYTRSTTAVNGGTQFLVEWSDDLSIWSSTGVSQTVLSDNGTVQQVKASIPAGSGGHRFVHLRVQ